MRRALFLAVLLLGLSPSVAAQFTPSGKLEIHYINVGQGGCTLIIGPNGTRILYDFGKVDGSNDIVPYLRDEVGLAPADGIHFAMVSHRDQDHYMGYEAVVDSGYDIIVATYGPGSSKTSTTIKSNLLDPAKKTTGGAIRPIPVGLPIALGDGAVALVMAAHGKVYGDPTPVAVSNENDKSVALYVSYKNFQFILDGDLGAGKEACTEHDTAQKDIQSRVAQSLINLKLMSSDRGVDVMHISHHGSESSTSAAYYNLMKPEVGLISVGLNQGTFLHPRKDVVDVVLLDTADRASCVTAAALLGLYQTEDGVEGSSSTGETSFNGETIGDIKLVTDGMTGYTITGNFRVHGWTKKPQGFPDPPELPDDSFEKTFALDEGNP